MKEFRKTKDGKNLPNVRQMSNLFDKASKFKCDSGECGQETNNIAGLFFAQEVAHDTSDRNVKQIIGFYNRFFFFQFFTPREIQGYCICSLFFL